MEIAVPVFCGLCISLCCACALGCFEPACGQSPSALGSMDLPALCHAIGRWPLLARAGARGPLAAAAGELAHLTLGTQRPFEFYGAEQRVGVCALLSCATGALGLLVAWSAWGIVAALLPVALLSALAAKRERDRACVLETAMPEAFGSLAISLGSGYSLAQAMRFVGARAQEPVRGEFMRVSFAIDCGVPAPRALDAMLGRLRAPGLELVVLALKVSKRTGAPLGELLSEAALLCRQRLELRRMLDVKTSQARMSARLVAIMPVAMVLLLTLLSQDFRRGLATQTGVVSVAVALALNALAWTIIKRIMDVGV